MDWLIYGCGGHGRVVYDILRATGFEPGEILFVDDLYQQGDTSVFALRVPASVNISNRLPKEPHRYVVAVGDNQAREKLDRRLARAGHQADSAFHPDATLSPEARLVGRNLVICAGSNVGPGATLRRGVIVNTLANVDHDCEIGEYTHIAPHANLCGNVKVGRGCLIGAGAILLPGATIEDGATVGAGAVVLEGGRVGKGQTVVGMPAHGMNGRHKGWLSSLRP